LHREELARGVTKSLQEHIFKNRFTLHPRSIIEIGEKEVEQLLKFCTNSNPDSVISWGKALAKAGIGNIPFQKMHTFLRQFLFERTVRETSLSILEINTFVSDYCDHAYYGFIHEMEQQIFKDQEQLRRALSTALEKQRQELIVKNHAIHTSTNGIMLTDLRGMITYVNPAFLSIWGLTDWKSILHTNCHSYLGVGDFNKVVDELEHKGGWQREFQHEMQDKNTYDLYISASLIRNAEQNPIGIMASFLDVSEKKRLENQFRQVQKMDALGQLAGGIVHDFNNLLQVISGYTELELSRIPKESEQYKNQMQIKVASDRGYDLTQQLRFFTRHSSGVKEPINLNEVVQETKNMMQHTLLPDISIDVELESELRVVMADSSQMIQILLNLCVNARDAIREKKKNAKKHGIQSDPGRICITSSNVKLDKKEAGQFIQGKPGSYTCICVKDNGIGIEAAIMDRLFEPFFTTKGVKSGTGLGLSVVYGIVQNHNGFIDVSSEPSVETSFSIYLPAVEKDLFSQDEKDYAPYLIQGKGTVLIVEDEQQVRTLAKDALEISGYTVIPAKDGVHALSLFEEYRDTIDLVVLDMVMPRMDGKECFIKLKKMKSNIKILIMTGYTTDVSLQDFRKKGALGIIEKPFDLQFFTKSVYEAIGA
jgi:PAS domain S-box-containing protein